MSERAVRRVVRAGALLGLLLVMAVGGCAFGLSFVGLQDYAEQIHAVPSGMGWAVSAALEGTALIGSLMLFVTAVAKRYAARRLRGLLWRVAAFGWLLTLVGAGVSVYANAMHPDAIVRALQTAGQTVRLDEVAPVLAGAMPVLFVLAVKGALYLVVLMMETASDGAIVGASQTLPDGASDGASQDRWTVRLEALARAVQTARRRSSDDRLEGASDGAQTASETARDDRLDAPSDDTETASGDQSQTLPDDPSDDRLDGAGATVQRRGKRVRTGRTGRRKVGQEEAAQYVREQHATTGVIPENSAIRFALGVSEPTARRARNTVLAELDAQDGSAAEGR